jgi:hypothetical protein
MAAVLKTAEAARPPGVRIPLPPLCPVSRHRGHLLQDIVHRPASADGLVAARGVQGESTYEFAVGDDPDVRTGHEQADLAVLVWDIGGNVSEPAEVAESYSEANGIRDGIYPAVLDRPDDSDPASCTWPRRRSGFGNTDGHARCPFPAPRPRAPTTGPHAAASGCRQPAGPGRLPDHQRWPNSSRPHLPKWRAPRARPTGHRRRQTARGARGGRPEDAL